MLRPKALDHVGLVVSDLERSLRFYCEGLGLELLRRSGPKADGVSSAVLKVGTQEINVFCDPNGGPTQGEGAERIHHFCLAMDGSHIDEVVAALRQAGIEVAKGPVQRRDGTSLFVEDPDGIRVELSVKN